MTDQIVSTNRRSAPWYFRAPVVMLPALAVHLLPVHWMTAVLASLGLLFVVAVLHFEHVHGEERDRAGRLLSLVSLVVSVIAFWLGIVLMYYRYPDGHDASLIWHTGPLVLTLVAYACGVWSYFMFYIEPGVYTRPEIGEYIYERWDWFVWTLKVTFRIGD